MMENQTSKESRQIVLVVDDGPENLAVIGELLRPNYSIQVANNGERALQLAKGESRPDLILLDVMRPGMDGHRVLQELKDTPRTAEIPVIFLTARSNEEDQLKGFELGAVDYITKPIVPAVMLARVHTHLELKQARDRLSNKNAWLESEVSRRMAENELIQTVSIRALAHLAEIHDTETGNHINRTQGYVRVLALWLRKHPRFSDFLSPHNIELLAKSAPLHDIGKVGIPDEILLKRGKLTLPEWAVMKTHARLGSDAIEMAEKDADQPVDFLNIAKQIARWHHEKWDGSGYPDGLKGDDIPVAARLMAIADVFDALISRRVYKPAMPFEEARDIIVAGRGRHFDPDITDAFLACFADFVAIAERFREESS